MRCLPALLSEGKDALRGVTFRLREKSPKAHKRGPRPRKLRIVLSAAKRQTSLAPLLVLFLGKRSAYFASEI